MCGGGGGKGKEGKECYFMAKRDKKDWERASLEILKLTFEPFRGKKKENKKGIAFKPRVYRHGISGFELHEIRRT